MMATDIIYAYRRRGLDQFVTCDKEQYLELMEKPRLFEVKIFYEFEPEFECKFCGQPSRIDPSDQRPPVDYCMPEDHVDEDE